MSRRPTSNENQLSLFSEATQAAPSIPDNVLMESLDGRNKRHDTAGIQDPGPLEAPSPDDGAGLGAGESTATDGLRGSGTDGESPVRTGGSPEDGVPSGVGDSDEGVGVPPRRAGSTP